VALLPKLRYDSAEAVHARLHNTVCLYQGKAVYCSTTRQDGRERNPPDLGLFVGAYGTPYRDYQEIHSSDEDLQVTNLNLGYCNRGSKAYYIVRAPVRRYKQGIDSGSCYAVPPGENPKQIGKEYVSSQEFYNMLEGKYPTYEEALKSLSRDVLIRAFSRKLAVAQDELGLYKLHYYSQPVAFLGRKDKFIVPKRFEHYAPIINRYGIELEIGD
jgi:hypothetical protein